MTVTSVELNLRYKNLYLHDGMSFLGNKTHGTDWAFIPFNFKHSSKQLHFANLDVQK